MCTNTVQVHTCNTLYTCVVGHSKFPLIRGTSKKKKCCIGTLQRAPQLHVFKARRAPWQLLWVPWVLYMITLPVSTPTPIASVAHVHCLGAPSNAQIETWKFILRRGALYQIENALVSLAFQKTQQ